MSENTVLTMSSWRDVHEIIVKTKEGRSCSILIHDDGGGAFDTDILISGLVGSARPAMSYGLKSTTPTSTPKEHFNDSLLLITAHLKQYAPTDEMADFWNPCNTPFVSQLEQNEVLAALGIGQVVRVN
ncbi:hypothetical protein BJF92_00610 [Rhizobium rhizosphaerae]|uniref:Uncharacterized protein n=1 Tax=Xaviernesmea rhizosphaerae TaxID=1672749 RepID=A0A1Q9AEF8_9HYPH|nr:hypothetical protein [Xaviernesmea rhizosphaerae]OLP53303.1 hypothetical protein BJF92_00610 [Xaviernesmea rhizosphaerae]